MENNHISDYIRMYCKDINRDNSNQWLENTLNDKEQAKNILYSIVGKGKGLNTEDIATEILYQCCEFEEDPLGYLEEDPSYLTNMVKVNGDYVNSVKVFNKLFGDPYQLLQQTDEKLVEHILGKGHTAFFKYNLKQHKETGFKRLITNYAFIHSVRMARNLHDILDDFGVDEKINENSIDLALAHSTPKAYAKKEVNKALSVNYNLSLQKCALLYSTKVNEKIDEIRIVIGREKTDYVGNYMAEHLDMLTNPFVFTNGSGNLLCLNTPPENTRKNNELRFERFKKDYASLLMRIKGQLGRPLPYLNPFAVRLSREIDNTADLSHLGDEAPLRFEKELYVIRETNEFVHRNDLWHPVIEHLRGELWNIVKNQSNKLIESYKEPDRRSDPSLKRLAENLEHRLHKIEGDLGFRV